MTVNFKDISAMILWHRERSGLSQTQIARIAGIGKTAVFDLEHGKSTVRWDTLAKLLQALNIKTNFTSPLMDEFKAAVHEKR